MEKEERCKTGTVGGQLGKVLVRSPNRIISLIS